MPLHEPRRYNHYAADKSGQARVLNSFDDICGVQQQRSTVTLYGDNYHDIRAVIRLRPGEWVEAASYGPPTIDALKSE
jgi:hypothetical protein